MNLAKKPIEERLTIEAEKACHYIRHVCGKLDGWQRQACARKLLDGHPEDQRVRIRAAMQRESDRK